MTSLKNVLKTFYIDASVLNELKSQANSECIYCGISRSFHYTHFGKICTKQTVCIYNILPNGNIKLA